ncbi:hydroxymethylglutaryl-CoA reductase, degradative [Aquicoccus porphyridii]|uniref:3-hydroxy-3-methylglutaryl coenzyme A reductase n=1 Tax=Aquicoccus porphyridii TaxID=1852029 RepID=A0A5A9ZG73_9RHOB|nr:hydroxymethylglutaryl-CoA reductase, degradative [Aquicoccus porphyridii]KAA0916258.1 hydroxymethylglutaryl-CoA reductase, degradative [Aquicoccus porphyridii]RAI53615.1 hydroxymethylglutaryl-CoA reductase, degradative [Rhodobacteraceae bacterium AsT-22]
MSTSRIPGFHNLTREERLAKVADLAGLDAAQVAHLTAAAAHDGVLADHLSENVISVMAVPLGVATNLIVDGAEVLVPMASEESSVVAAVCNGARACREAGGIVTQADDPCMIAQVQVTGLDDLEAARAAVLAQKQAIAAECDGCDPMLVRLGGGFRDVEVRIAGPFLVVHLIVDVRDAMGANAVNTMAERLAPKIEGWTGGKVGLRILSNLADRRLVRARATWRVDEIGAETVAGIIGAWEFAAHDPYRAATHNKGIMNGVAAVALATGNDTRALEAGAHAFAAKDGYGPLTRYWIEGADLVGEIEMPMPVGIVGGATRAHPTAQASLRIMGVETADRLARVMAAVGLVQNFSALRALATEGIQRGHMGLHARNVAIAAGASGDEIDRVAAEMIARGEIREDVARELLV